MSVDPGTRDFYDREAAGYADFAADEVAAATRWLGALAAATAPGGRVLDLGCGPGWAAAWFAGRGFAVEAIDASAGCAAEARARYGLEVTVADFASLTAEAEYSAVWAAFSLLHVPRAELAPNLARIRRALRPGGWLYLGLKEGTGTDRDRLGRAYTFYREDEIAARLADAGFAIAETALEPGTGYDGTPCRSLHVLARADD